MLTKKYKKFCAIVIVIFAIARTTNYNLKHMHTMSKVCWSSSNILPLLHQSMTRADIERGRLYIISSALLPLRRPPESLTAVRRHQTTSIIYDRDRDAACGLFLCLSCALVHSLCNKWIVNAFPAVFPSVSFSLFPLMLSCYAASHKSTGKLIYGIWH